MTRSEHWQIDNPATKVAVAVVAQAVSDARRHDGIGSEARRFLRSEGLDRWAHFAGIIHAEYRDRLAQRIRESHSG